MNDSERMLESLSELAHDCWWSWNEIGRRPFSMIDPRLWEATMHSPIRMLREVPPALMHSRLEDGDFRQVVQKAHAARERYHGTGTWFSRVAKNGDERMLVAYFCSEYAIHESMPQYSGGLGVLAGDLLVAPPARIALHVHRR